MEETILDKINKLRELWRKETDPAKRKVYECQARMLKHTSYYKNPAQKNIRWN